ncbi:hypothetical protein [Alloprevotella tannerae]|uniref:hypothetical protein n=1 Tax=Alloprevotella tannerae TaxID=76122 RepID=UPI0028E63124|nr:hypothetical protein [Alloprevotella tannerae]
MATFLLPTSPATRLHIATASTPNGIADATHSLSFSSDFMTPHVELFHLTRQGSFEGQGRGNGVQRLDFATHGNAYVQSLHPTILVYAHERTPFLS